VDLQRAPKLRLGSSSHWVCLFHHTVVGSWASPTGDDTDGFRAVRLEPLLQPGCANGRVCTRAHSIELKLTSACQQGVHPGWRYSRPGCAFPAIATGTISFQRTRQAGMQARSS
jgi:hypothetical protein